MRFFKRMNNNGEISRSAFRLRNDIVELFGNNIRKGKSLNERSRSERRYRSEGTSLDLNYFYRIQQRLYKDKIEITTCNIMLPARQRALFVVHDRGNHTTKVFINLF